MQALLLIVSLSMLLLSIFKISLRAASAAFTASVLLVIVSFGTHTAFLELVAPATHYTGKSHIIILIIGIALLVISYSVHQAIREHRKVSAFDPVI